MFRMFCVNMVNGQQERLGLSATGAFISVMRENFLPQSFAVGPISFFCGHLFRIHSITPPYLASKTARRRRGEYGRNCLIGRILRSCHFFRFYLTMRRRFAMILTL